MSENKAIRILSQAFEYFFSILSVFWGWSWILLGEFACRRCYPGGVFDSRDQPETHISATRLSRGLTAFRNAVAAPSYAFAA